MLHAAIFWLALVPSQPDCPLSPWGRSYGDVAALCDEQTIRYRAHRKWLVEQGRRHWEDGRWAVWVEQCDTYLYAWDRIGYYCYRAQFDDSDMGQLASELGPKIPDWGPGWLPPLLPAPPPAVMPPTPNAAANLGG